MRELIHRVIEIKGDGSDPDYIHFGTLNYIPIAFMIQATPVLPFTYYYDNFKYEYSLDGVEWQTNPLYKYTSNGITETLSGYIDFIGPFVRLPLGQFIEKGYVGRLAIVFNFGFYIY